MVEAQHLALHRPPERSPEADANFRRALLEVAPIAVQKVLIFVVRIDLEAIDVDEIGLVHRVCPAEIGIVSMQHEG